jgi:glyoxylase-like metal-dependent hydrolase (beta-lactamase superfamily II)
LREWLDEGRKVAMLDIRSPEEFHESRIPGSVNLDVYDALDAGDLGALDAAALPGSRPVVTICGRGRVAAIASTALEARGIESLTLDGGLHAWSAAWNTAEVHLDNSSACILQVRRSAKGCLSYIVAGRSTAAVIDPSVEPSVYVRLANERGWTIRYVLDTHVHADHLSRAKALAELAGADLMLPRTGRVKFAFQPIDDGARISLEDTQILALNSPGHTPESTTYVIDGRAAITGDTLFLNGVGRPDLHKDERQRDSAAHDLYHSVQRLAELYPDILVLPGHISEVVPFDRRPIAARLNDIRASNPLFNASESDFVQMITERTLPTPPNYEQITELNAFGIAPEGDPLDLEAGANRCAAM